MLLHDEIYARQQRHCHCSMCSHVLDIAVYAKNKQEATSQPASIIIITTHDDDRNALH